MVLLCAVSTSFARGARQDKAGSPQPANQIRILVLTDTSQLLSVRYENTDSVVRKEFQILQKVNRRPIVEVGIGAAFKAGVKCFEAVIPPDPSAYITGKDINFSKAQADGYPYVLSIRETFAGLGEVAGSGSVSAGSEMEFRLIDAASGKELGKGKASSFSPNKRDLDAATKDAGAFFTDYADAATDNIIDIYGQLSKGGQLHAMAEAHGLGNEVPAE
ncbi:MAG: hypothetical protein ACLQBK_23885 [Candidatus Sulfotelmatobacter sp.]